MPQFHIRLGSARIHTGLGTLAPLAVKGGTKYQQAAPPPPIPPHLRTALIWRTFWPLSELKSSQQKDTIESLSSTLYIYLVAS